MATTIKLHLDTKQQLDKFREYANESYDEVIRKVVFIAKNSGSDLSKETIEGIKKARARIKQGKFLSARDARKRLGL